MSGYQPDIIGLLNGYQDKIDQISIKYLILTEYQKYVLVIPGYKSNTSGLWPKSNKLEKSLITEMFRSNPTAGYQ